ncbi:MAG: hypothetical protein KDD32_03710 [Bacteroidetes bacterium]|nr:hypothetical protein [Bacteroidota bacterium]
MKKIDLLLVSMLFCINVFGHGELHDRINLVSQELQLRPNLPELYVKRGGLFMDDGDYQNTILDIEKAKSLAGEDYPPCMFLLAKMYFKLETYDAALKEINNFLATEDDHVLGLLTKAEILIALDENEAAAKCYQQAIEKTTTLLPENFFDLINVQIANDQLDNAFKNYQLAQLKFGNLLVFDLKAIEIAELRNDYTSIHEILDNIIDSQQRKERWYYKKAEFFLKETKYEQSIEQLKFAKESLLQLPYRIRITPAMQELSKNISDTEQNIKSLLNDSITTENAFEN